MSADPQNVDEKVRLQFWRIVGQIKRTPKPEEDVVIKATEIRDLLYEQRLGTPKSLKWLFLWVASGTLVVFHYFWHVLFIPNNIAVASFSHQLRYAISILGYRGATVALVVFLYYPFGRLIAGKLTGIQLDGITRDIYYLPTLKVNYVTYLHASPPKRQWFFFFAGYWTAFTALWVGSIGFLLNHEIAGVGIGVALAFLETLGALIGGKWAGELGHFHRERRIVHDWRSQIKE